MDLLLAKQALEHISLAEDRNQRRTDNKGLFIVTLIELIYPATNSSPFVYGDATFPPPLRSEVHHHLPKSQHQFLTPWKPSWYKEQPSRLTNNNQRSSRIPGPHAIQIRLCHIPAIRYKTHRQFLLKVLIHPLLLFHAPSHLLPQFRPHHTRNNGIHADLLRGEFGRQPLGEGENRAV